MSELPAGLPEGAELASTGGFNEYIGPLYRLPDLSGGTVKRFCFIAAAQHMNSAGSVHGGMLMSFFDVSMSRTARLSTGTKKLATVSLTTDFTGPGRLDDVLISTVEITRRTRTMLFMSADIRARGKLIAMATGLWKIVEPA